MPSPATPSESPIQPELPPARPTDAPAPAEPVPAVAATAPRVMHPVAVGPWINPANLDTRITWYDVFGNDNPVVVDLGAGDGGFATQMAVKHPEKNFLAVERLLGRARKIARAAEHGHIPNLKVLRLEAGFTVHYLFPAESLETLYLLFPDPWPKRRHWGRRIVQSPFMQHVAAALKVGGIFRFRSDHEDYFQHAVGVLEKEAAYVRLKDEELWPLPQTDFEQEFAKEGRRFYDAAWRRVKLAAH
ncbi:tRNA (guanosine(46)-N7)-methyltransferase TrmB [Verrucomicrobia bacterium LW23]|nr:tRNA (guanosine(46)-N7)-methyltransferase TrmB [Verrucomicrobia bacterium LW23]